MELKSPVRKRGKNPPLHASLPILVDPASSVDGEPMMFTGCFNGASVVVDNPEEISTLYRMGFFGKGSLSRSFPNFGKRKNGVPPVLSERQWKRRKEWESKLSDILQNMPKPNLCDKYQMEVDACIEINDGKEITKKVEEVKSDKKESVSEVESGTEVKDGQNVEVIQTESEPACNTDVKKHETISIDDDGSNNSAKDSDIQIIEEKDDDIEIICKVPGPAETKLPLNESLREQTEKETDIEIIDEKDSDVHMIETHKVPEVEIVEENDCDVRSVEEIGENLDLQTSQKGELSQVESNISKKGEYGNSADTSMFHHSQSQRDTEILVIADKNEVMLENLSDLKPHIEKETVQLVLELLYLTLEEAFFLSFALGCLNVCDLSGQNLGLQEMWMIFNNSQNDFTESYIAYHYFRSKGWVVKTGLKFGGNFLLYKDGPAYHHASYIVIIDNINKIKDVDQGQSRTWAEMLPLYRMGEASKKEILICHILWPNDLKNIKSPSLLKSFKVSETLLRRWLPSHEKDEE